MTEDGFRLVEDGFRLVEELAGVSHTRDVSEALGGVTPGCA